MINITKSLSIDMLILYLQIFVYCDASMYLKINMNK